MGVPVKKDTLYINPLHNRHPLHHHFHLHHLPVWFGDSSLNALFKIEQNSQIIVAILFAVTM